MRSLFASGSRTSRKVYLIRIAQRDRRAFGRLLVGHRFLALMKRRSSALECCQVSGPFQRYVPRWRGSSFEFTHSRTFQLPCSPRLHCTCWASAWWIGTQSLVCRVGTPLKLQHCTWGCPSGRIALFRRVFQQPWCCYPILWQASFLYHWFWWCKCREVCIFNSRFL